jgi:hypothetical protein
LTAPVIPSVVKSITTVSMLIFLGIAVFGVFTGIGMMRLRNWERISILVFSGLIVLFGGIALLLLMAIPFPANPTGPPVDPRAVKAIVLLVYGIPVLIGIGWLVLFNLKGTRAQFAGTPSETSAGISVAPACPLPVHIIAVFFLFSLLWVLVLPFLQMPFPAIFFGHPFYGATGKALFMLFGVLLGGGAIGLLKLKKWSYPLVLGIQGLGLFSGAATMFSPTFPRLMQEMLSQMHFPENMSFPFSMRQLRFLSSLGLLLSVLVIGILVLLSPPLHAGSCRAALPSA